MTEEIIIDGVNVAGCFYFIDHTPPKGQGDWCGAIHKGACKVYSKDCEYNKDCYYKQLKRLEQENEELKAEKERLKEEIEIRDNLSEAFRKEALNWANIANEYQKDRTKLEKKLQEIKLIAEADVLNEF